MQVENGSTRKLVVNYFLFSCITNQICASVEPFLAEKKVLQPMYSKYQDYKKNEFVEE